MIAFFACDDGTGAARHYHGRVLRHIDKRWLLIVLLAGGQALALLVGAVWLINWMDISLSRIVRQRVAANTAMYAAQIGVMIDDMHLRSLSNDSDDWRRLQSLIERSHLPYDGFLCVVDSTDGRIICHPDLRSDPSVAHIRLGDQPLHGVEPIRTLAEAGMGSQPDSGTVEMPDGVHLVAVRDLPQVGAKLLVHQRERSVLATVNQFVSRVRTIVLVLGIVVVTFSTVLTMAIARRYENRLAQINEGLERLVEKRSQALLKSRSAVIFGLAKLAESRDDQTGQHLDRIRRYVQILAETLAGSRADITADYVETLADTSSLHDIGKVGIPDAVLLHPGRLNEEQLRIIRKHPLIGGDTLLAIRRVWGDDPFLVTACEIVFAHHEKWDGSGYPFGLAGQDIPLAARIVAVADVYDALTSHRAYKEAMSHAEARKVILAGAGTHFDPEVVEAFRSAEQAFLASSEARPNNQTA